jgi:hypothetical protein
MGLGGEAVCIRPRCLPANDNWKKQDHKMITTGIDVAVVSPERVA